MKTIVRSRTMVFFCCIATASSENVKNKKYKGMKTKKFILPESEMPKAWYNIVADMPNKPMPCLDPQTKQPVTFEIGRAHV